MNDSFGRDINYLRVSLTDRCNLRCVYCMPPSGVPMLSHDEILRYEEITRIVRILAREGVTRVKLTGGEPLVRRDVPVLVRMLKSVEGIEEVTLTSNGVLLGRELPGLIEAGLDAVNVSLDTLNTSAYREITGGGSVETVLSSIDACMRAGIRTKINCVPVTDEEDLCEVAALARDREIHVRFIEKMPLGNAGTSDNFPSFHEEDIRAALEKRFGPLTPCAQRLGNGPARYFSVEGFKGRIGFISAISHAFCGSCTRLRLTSTGYLKTCLYYEDGVDLKPLLAGTDDEIAGAVESAVRRKRYGHRFSEDMLPEEDSRAMYMIGG